jgi:uncharacterized protein YbaA (DUF1428 family)
VRGRSARLRAFDRRTPLRQARHGKRMIYGGFVPVLELKE